MFQTVSPTMFRNALQPSFGTSSSFIQQTDNQPTHLQFDFHNRGIPVGCIDNSIPYSHKDQPVDSPSQSSERMFTVGSSTPSSSGLDSNQTSETATMVQPQSILRVDADEPSPQAPSSKFVGYDRSPPSTTAVHVCPDCGKWFPERSFLLRHRTCHGEAKHICPICNRAFVRDDKLKRHIRCLHSSERPYKCETCPKAFARKDKLQEHVRHHNRDITFPCPICQELFVMRSHLNRHLRGVHKIKLTQNNSYSVIQDLSQTTTACSLPSNISSEIKSAFTPVNINFSASGLYNHNAVGEATETFTSTDLNPPDQLSNGRHSRKKRAARRHLTTQETKLADTCLTIGDSSHVSGSAVEQTVSTSPIGSNLFPSGCLQELSVNDTSQQHVFESTCSGVQLSPASTVQSNLLSPPSYGSAELSQHQHSQFTSNHPVRNYEHQQQLSSPSTWSAAVAASLFAPVNYVSWWSQHNPSFMLPNPSPAAIANQGSSSNNVPNTYLQRFGASQASEDVNHAQPHYVDLAYAQHTTQRLTPSWGQRTGSYSAPAAAAAASAHMLSALPSFAQAMYYRAATWAATRNSDGSHNHWNPRQLNTDLLYPSTAVVNDV